jgi:hypothetical protein
MDDCFLMYRVSLERLRMMDYCNGVESFINYALSNMKISKYQVSPEGLHMILDVHVKGMKIKSISI